MWALKHQEQYFVIFCLSTTVTKGSVSAIIVPVLIGWEATTFLYLDTRIAPFAT